ncbi:hypothetical protein LTS10_005189 [Elasticomyces elasticus]|nr:hypothetical protein LTS10_005189 [Elasticomyces elasticus]
MTTDASRRAVFTTAELLENILMHTPIESVFTAQRVSTQFRDIVAKSVQLQQKLFLRLPILQPTERWTVVGPPSPRVIRLDSKDDLPANVAVSVKPREKSCLYKPATMLNPHFQTWQGDSNDMNHFAWRTLNRTTDIELRSRSRALTDSGTWREMYLAQLVISWGFGMLPDQYGTMTGTVQTQNSQGFTIGALIEAVLDTEHESYQHNHGLNVIYTGKTSVKNLIKKLEIETGKMARMTYLRVEMQDVLLPTERERGMVKDI